MIIFMLCWTVVSFNYYLVLFHLEKMDGNVYLNGFAMAAAELAGNLVIGVLIWQLGLKHTMLGAFTLMGVAAFVYEFAIVPIALWYAIALFVLRFSNTCAFASVFYGTNALFKEELVAVIFALCNLTGRFFTIFAPLIAIGSDLTIVIICIALSLVAILLTSFISDKKFPPGALDVQSDEGSSGKKSSGKKRSNSKKQSPK
jgi:hypothetical protein